MLLPLNKTLRLHIGRQRVRGALCQGWPTPANLATAMAHYDPSPGPGGPTLATALKTALKTALETVLATLLQGVRGRRPRLHVELCDALVLLDVARGDFSHTHLEQLQAMARACVHDIVGDTAAQHEVRWQLQSGLQHLLLCAVPSAVLDAVQSTAQQHRLAVVSVQPEFCVAWNRHARVLGAQAGAFAMLGEVSTLALVGPKTNITAISCTALPAADARCADPDAAAMHALELQLQRLAPSSDTRSETHFRRVLVSAQTSPAWQRSGWATPGAPATPEKSLRSVPAAVPEST